MRSASGYAAPQYFVAMQQNICYIARIRSQ
jgi:hypothetical protein